MTIKNWDFSVERSHFLIFGGARSFLKFWWSTVISQILVEHGHLSYFGGALSFVIFWWKNGHKNLRKQIKIKIGWLANLTKLHRVHGTSEHCSSNTSLFNPKGNHRLSFVIFWWKNGHKNLRKQIKIKLGWLANLTKLHRYMELLHTAPVILPPSTQRAIVDCPRHPIFSRYQLSSLKMKP